MFAPVFLIWAVWSCKGGLNFFDFNECPKIFCFFCSLYFFVCSFKSSIEMLIRLTWEHHWLSYINLSYCMCLLGWLCLLDWVSMCVENVCGCFNFLLLFAVSKLTFFLCWQKYQWKEKKINEFEWTGWNGVICVKESLLC